MIFGFYFNIIDRLGFFLVKIFYFNQTKQKRNENIFDKHFQDAKKKQTVFTSNEMKEQNNPIKLQNAKTKQKKTRIDSKWKKY